MTSKAGTLHALGWDGVEGAVSATIVDHDLSNGAYLIDVHDNLSIFEPGEARWVFPSRGFRFEADGEVPVD